MHTFMCHTLAHDHACARLTPSSYAHGRCRIVVVRCLCCAQVLQLQGSPPRDLFAVVLAGSVDLCASAAHGQSDVRLCTLHRGAYFGEVDVDGDGGGDDAAGTEATGARAHGRVRPGAVFSVVAASAAVQLACVTKRDLLDVFAATARAQAPRDRRPLPSPPPSPSSAPFPSEALRVFRFLRTKVPVFDSFSDARIVQLTYAAQLTAFANDQVPRRDTCAACVRCAATLHGCRLLRGTRLW